MSVLSEYSAAPGDYSATTPTCCPLAFGLAHLVAQRLLMSLLGDGARLVLEPSRLARWMGERAPGSASLISRIVTTETLNQRQRA